jgi:hypothetical protein
MTRTHDPAIMYARGRGGSRARSFRRTGSGIHQLNPVRSIALHRISRTPARLPCSPRLLTRTHPIGSPSTRARLLLKLTTVLRLRLLSLLLLLMLLLNPDLGLPFLPLDRFLPILDPRRDPPQDIFDIVCVDSE